MHSMQRLAPAANGIAQELQRPVSIRGSDAQQFAQQEAVRSRHGSSASQTMHHDGRTIRSVWRPTIDNALPKRLSGRLCTAVNSSRSDT